MSYSHINQRISLLEDWLCQYYPKPTLHSLSGDASFRNYFRISTDTGSVLAVDMPPDKEKIIEYVQITQYLKAKNILVPRIYHSDIQQGFLVIEDFGDQLFSTQLNKDTADELYQKAIDILIKIQSVDTKQLATYDREKLIAEMQIFTDWYCIQHTQTSLSNEQIENLNDAYQFLATAILEQPQVFVHRDYHSRNLICTDSGSIATIDFQDAVNGSVTYDLVSLLKDCYVEWPREKQLQWIDYYLSNTNITINKKDFIYWFDLTGVQRHLKATGIFARLYHRDQKSGYLKDIPRTLSYIAEVCEIYPPLHQLQSIIQTLNKL